MAALALKAIDYGAEKIPDRLFEKIPGGYFTPAEKKNIDKKRGEDRRRSEQRYGERGGRRSHRDRTPPTDYSDYSGYDDTDYEKEYRSKQRRRRARSLGRSISRSPSRGRYRKRSDTGDLDGEMDRAERAERAPEFPPPPASEYRPYNPQDYAPVAAATGAAVANQYYDHHDRRSSSAMPEYGYPPQPKPLHPRSSVSSSAARYTPAGVYSQAPMAAPVAQPTSVYAPYNPSDYASPSPMNKAPVPYQPSPPPFYRQQSRSQPSLPQYPYPDNQVEYLAQPSRHSSTASSHHRRHGDGKPHRTRSAGHHGRSRSRVTDQLRDRFENLDTKDKAMAASVGGALAGGLAGNALRRGTLSTLVGAAIGGLGGREMGKRRERKHDSREVSLASQAREKRQSRSGVGKQHYSRSASRDGRKTARYHSSSDFSSDSDSDGHRRAARRRR